MKAICAECSNTKEKRGLAASGKTSEKSDADRLTRFHVRNHFYRAVIWFVFARYSTKSNPRKLNRMMLVMMPGVCVRLCQCRLNV